jgi:ketosteroid isomerase-like protein
MTHDTETPREMFEHMLRGWLSNTVETTGDLLADDVVIEAPFAPPGRPQRTDGRAAFLAVARPGRAALPIHFDEARVVAVHETADPEVIVVEYQLGGIVTTTGERNRASFIGVLRVRAGKITHWREYQDTALIARTLGGQRTA